MGSGPRSRFSIAGWVMYYIASLILYIIRDAAGDIGIRWRRRRSMEKKNLYFWHGFYDLILKKNNAHKLAAVDPDVSQLTRRLCDHTYTHSMWRKIIILMIRKISTRSTSISKRNGLGDWKKIWRRRDLNVFPFYLIVGPIACLKRTCRDMVIFSV